MKLLQIDSSINGEQSISRTLTSFITENWVAQHPETEVEYLDLAVDAPNHFSADAMGIRNPALGESANLSMEAENAVSERLVTQFLAADVIVMAAPFYNFTIPSQLKAWIDRILQPRRTFRYTDNGPEGLAGGKKVIVVSSRGGVYSSSEQGQALEHQESYLKVIFGFVGINDIDIIRAEGIGKGPEAAAEAVASAKAQVMQLLDQPATA